MDQHAMDQRDHSYRSDLDRRNDARLLTPLLLMATILVVGVLVSVYTGHPLA